MTDALHPDDDLVADLRALPPDLPDVPDRLDRVRGLRDRHRRRRTAGLAGLAAAAAVAVAATSAVRAGGLPSPGPAAATSASTCPRLYGPGPTLAGPGEPWVPGSPSVPDGGARMVPEQVPSAALVCRYPDGAIDTASPDEPYRVPLEGGVRLAGGLDAVAADLTWLPKERLGAERTCTAIGGPTTYYLLGLTYPDGVVWVSGAKDPNSCHQSWNGRFASGANLGGQLEASYDRGAWAGAETWVPPGEEILGGPCGGMHRAGRLGDERAIVPAGAVSLVVCDSSPAGSGAVTIDDPARVAQAAGVVNGLDRGRGDGSCSMLDPDAAPSDVTFVFRYAAGPPVVVRADPNCRPGVLSGRFAVDDPTSLVAYAERLLAGG